MARFCQQKERITDEKYPVNANGMGHLRRALVLSILALQSIGSIAQSRHTIAQEPLLMSDGRILTIRVMDDRTVVYQPVMWRTSIGIQDGKLVATSTVAASRAAGIRHREPTATEAALWHKHFGV